ncbi:hypothetical protein BG841_03655 [Marinobacter sp. X15-166B]|nr:hypothetical protein BG841_03655 [Marinobacter sp. X15-166B]
MPGIIKRIKLHQGGGNYEDFISLLNDDLREAIDELAAAAHQKSASSEDDLTISIVQWLKARSWTASHETCTNGHVDITVIMQKYKWLGEAKKDNSYAHIWKGFQQLMTRYSPGFNFSARARETYTETHGILIYCQRSRNSGDFLRKWKEKLISECEGHSFHSCDSHSIDGLELQTTHRHPNSDEIVKIIHFAVPLYFQPQDR